MKRRPPLFSFRPHDYDAGFDDGYDDGDRDGYARALRELQEVAHVRALRVPRWRFEHLLPRLVELDKTGEVAKSAAPQLGVSVRTYKRTRRHAVNRGLLPPRRRRRSGRLETGSLEPKKANAMIYGYSVLAGVMAADVTAQLDEIRELLELTKAEVRGDA